MPGPRSVTIAVNVITVAALGERACEIGRALARDDSFSVTMTADTFPQLLRHDAFPTRVLLVDEVDDLDRTRARIEIAQGLGARVVLVVRQARSARLSWGADFVVHADVDRSELLRLVRDDAELRKRRRQEAYAAPPRTGFTEREREALMLWTRSESVAVVASQMQISNATASTFLWRARRKLSAGSAL